MTVSKYSDNGHLNNNSNGKPSDVETVVPPSEVLTLTADKDEQRDVQCEESADANIIGWDGEDDTVNPLNWTKRKKWSHVAIVALINFVTPLASSMFTPGVTQVQKEFDNYNHQLSSFVVSIYVLGCGYLPTAQTRGWER